MEDSTCDYKADWKYSTIKTKRKKMEEEREGRKEGIVGGILFLKLYMKYMSLLPLNTCVLKYFFFLENL